MSFSIGSEIKSTGRAEFTPEQGKVVVVGTIQCCHCLRVWHVTPGSGKRRGVCGRCSKVGNGITCGRKECDTCIGGHERLLDNLEAGLAWHEAMKYRPIIVPTND